MQNVLSNQQEEPSQSEDEDEEDEEEDEEEEEEEEVYVLPIINSIDVELLNQYDESAEYMDNS